MRTVFILTLFVLFLTGCNGRYKFWNISKFNIVDTALKDQEEIKLLYSSRGPDNNEDLKYLIHIVVISQRTGDTVNILTTIENGFSMEDKNKVFNYFDQNSIALKLIEMDPGQFKDMEGLKEESKSAIKKITKVTRDPKFDYLADNNYPTVIGTIGTVSK